MPQPFILTVTAPLRRWSASYPLRNASLSEGLRAAFCAGSMIMLGEWLHNPLFSWAAIGAFLTCLADSAGSNRARLASMGGFAVTSMLGGMFASSLSSAGMPAGLLAIMCCAGVAGMARIYGAATGLVLMLAAGVSAILADFPLVLLPLHRSHVLIYFAGCAWAMVLGLSVWRIHPFAPARKAVARVYGALADLAAVGGSQKMILQEENAAQTRRHARADIAAARAALMAVAADRADARQLYENLLIRLARADAMLDCITALGDLLLSRRQSPQARRRIVRVLNAMALLLRAIQRSVTVPAGRRNSNDDDAGNSDGVRAMLRLHQLIGRMPSQAAQLLQLPELRDQQGQTLLADLKRAARPPSPPSSEPAAALPRTIRHAWDMLRNAGTAEVQHALRCAAAAGATYLVVHMLALPFGYWATMATMLVMQPSIADSWTRSMERAVGSIVGGVLAVTLCVFVKTPLMLALLVFPLSALAMGLRPVSYGLYATFLTPVFVLLADVASDPAQQLSNALLRAGNNVIGAVVAIAATYLLWPRRQQVNLHRSLSHMILVNIAYLRSALQPQPDAALMHARRREACVANIESGLLLQRLLRERDMNERLIHGARTSIALSRRLAAAATHIWLDEKKATEPNPTRTQDNAGLEHWLRDMTDLFERKLTAEAPCTALLRLRPAVHDLAHADAVETVCLLAAAMYPQLRAAETI